MDENVNKFEPVIEEFNGEINKNDIIQFGRFPQGENGEIEPLKWRVLDIKDDKALLFCENIIASSCEHRFSNGSNNWGKSNIREWLNNTFYDSSFEKWEKERIIETLIDNSPKSANPYNQEKYYNNGINKFCKQDTLDKVFLLSLWDITNPNYGFKNELDEDILREKEPTNYAMKLESSPMYALNGYYLRSPYYSYYAYGYRISNEWSDKYGVVSYYYCSDRAGVVPAIVISVK